MSHSKYDAPYHLLSTAAFPWSSPVTWTMGPGGYSGFRSHVLDDPNKNLEDIYSYFYSIVGSVPWANTRDWSSMWPKTGTSPEGYAGHNYSESQIMGLIQDDIAAAFALWSEVANITFNYIPFNHTNQADIVLWCGEPSSAGSGTTQHAFGGAGSPSYNYHGDVHVHNHFRWYSQKLGLSTPTFSDYGTPTFSGYNGALQDNNILSSSIVDFRTVVAHEIGHSIGLGHVDTGSGDGFIDQIMYTYIWGRPIPQQNTLPSGVTKKLGWGDIAGAQYIFGANPSWTEPTITAVPDTVSLNLSSSLNVSGSLDNNDSQAGITDPILVVSVYNGILSAALSDEDAHIHMDDYATAIAVSASNPTTINGSYGTLQVYQSGMFAYTYTGTDTTFSGTEVFTYMIGTVPDNWASNPQTHSDYNILPVSAISTLTVNIGGGGTPPAAPGISLSGLDAHLGNWDTSPSVIKFSDYTLGSASLPSVNKNTDTLTLANSKKLKEFADPSDSAYVNPVFTSLEATSITMDPLVFPLPPLNGTSIFENVDMSINFNHNISNPCGTLPKFKFSLLQNGTAISAPIQESLYSYLNSPTWTKTFVYDWTTGDIGNTNKIRIDIEDFATGSMIQSDYLISFYACKYAYDISYTQIEWGYWDANGYKFNVWFNYGYRQYNTGTDIDICGFMAGSNPTSIGFSSTPYDLSYGSNRDWCGFGPTGYTNNTVKNYVNPTTTGVTAIGTAFNYCYDWNAVDGNGALYVQNYCNLAGSNCTSCTVPCPTSLTTPLCSASVSSCRQGGAPWACVSGIDRAYGLNGISLGTEHCTAASCIDSSFGLDPIELWSHNGYIQEGFLTTGAPPCLTTETISSMQLPSSSTPSIYKDWVDTSQQALRVYGIANNYSLKYLQTPITDHFNNSNCSLSVYDYQAGNTHSSYNLACKVGEVSTGIIAVKNIYIAFMSGTTNQICTTPSSTLSAKETNITINTLTHLNASDPGMATLRSIPTYNFPNLVPEATDLFTNRLNTSYVTNLYADLLPLHLSNVDLNSFARGTDGNKYVKTNTVSISAISAYYSNNSDCANA